MNTLYPSVVQNTSFSQGTAEVVFSRRTDALAAVKRYNNVQLDGKPMKIEIVGTNIATPAAPPANNVSFGNSNGVPRGYVLCSLYFPFSNCDSQFEKLSIYYVSSLCPPNQFSFVFDVLDLKHNLLWIQTLALNGPDLFQKVVLYFVILGENDFLRYNSPRYENLTALNKILLLGSTCRSLVEKVQLSLKQLNDLNSFVHVIDKIAKM